MELYREIGYEMLNAMEVAMKGGLSVSQPLSDNDPNIFRFTQGKYDSHPREQTMFIYVQGSNDVIAAVLYPVRPYFSERDLYSLSQKS